MPNLVPISEAPRASARGILAKASGIREREQMKEHAVARNALQTNPATGKEMNHWYSVLFSLRGDDHTYRSKVWDKATSSMHLLIEEPSVLLSRLKVGDTVNMMYYSTDPHNPSEYLEASVQHITKRDQGRLKGNYLIGLNIVRSSQ